MIAVKITREDFDSLENRHPWHITDEAYFIHNGTMSAYDRAMEYLRGKEIKRYKGYDGNWYPKFELTQIILQ